MLTIRKGLIVFAIPVLLLSIGYAEDTAVSSDTLSTAASTTAPATDTPAVAPAESTPAPTGEAPQLASATPTGSDENPATVDVPMPHYYCKELPSQNEETAICQEECCTAKQEGAPMTDCMTVAYPCHTKAPL